VSETRDLWVPLLLGAAGVAVLAASLLGGGSTAGGILGLLAAWTAAFACLPIRLRKGQAASVRFGVGILLVLVPLVPGAAPSVLSALPWVVLALAFVAPAPPLPPKVRAFLLGAAAVLAVLGVLTLPGLLPPRLTWLLLAGAAYFAVQTVNARPRKEPPPPRGPRIAVMGGSFDPFHRGHRVLAEAALRVVDRLLVVPAGRAPHKQAGREPTDFHHRLAMARIGVEGLPRTEVLELEGRRTGPSYTIDTLDVVRKSHAEDARFLLLLGADMYQDFPTWKDWERIVENTALLVARRPGFDLDTPPELEGRGVLLEPLEAPLVDASSTAIREALARGESVGDLVSPAVLAYVREHGLYGTFAAGAATSP